VTEKEADCVSKEKAETSTNDSEYQEESPLAEGSTKPELDAITVPENNDEEDEECDKSTTSRRSRVTFKSSKSEDEESVRSRPRQGTVSHLKEKFNRLARSPSINRVSSGVSYIGKPKIKVPVKVYDNGPLEKAERDDTETTTDEKNILMDLAEPDSMKRTCSFKSAPPYCMEKTPPPLSLPEQEILEVESVTSRFLNDDEDNCEIEIEAVDSKSSSLRRSPPPNTEPEAISLAVKRVVSF
jgi:hypothetical protein